MTDENRKHDDHGFRLKPSFVPGRKDVWWYEENDGIHIVVEPQREATQFRITWRALLAAAKRGGKV